MSLKRIWKHPIQKEIKTRIHSRNQNCLIHVSGEPGSGKSYVTCELARRLDDQFEDQLEKRIVYSAEELLKLINHDKTLKKGSCIILDEAAVSATAYESTYNTTVKALAFLVTTFRYKNLIVFWISPHAFQIQKTVRSLITHQIEAMRVITSTNRNLIKFKRVTWGVKHGKPHPYRKHLANPVLNVKNTSYDIKRMPKRMMERYEKISREYKESLALDLENQILIEQKEKEDLEKKKSFDPLEEAKKLLDDETLWRKGRGGRWMADLTRISMRLNVGRSYAERVKKAMEDMRNSEDS